MAEAPKQVRVDDRRRCRRIAAIGGEDRALLRSNPSARSDAGTGAGVQTTSRLPPTPTCSGGKAQNLGGPGAEPPQRLQSRAVCHLARSVGADECSQGCSEAEPLEGGRTRTSRPRMGQQKPAALIRDRGRVCFAYPLRTPPKLSRTRGGSFCVFTEKLREQITQQDEGRAKDGG